MQSLSPTLRAAQRTRGGVASLRLRVEDRELRWAPLVDDLASECLTAACAAQDAIVRARITPAGTLDLQRITTPADPGQWLAWNTLTADAHPATDLALSPLAADPARLRLFYSRASAGGACAIACLQSVDGGRSWSPPADCLAGLPAPATSLASANAQLFYHDPADGFLKLAHATAWEGGVWSPVPWVEAGALVARFGLAAGYDGGVYHVASCDEEAPDVRRLRTGALVEATGAWAPPAPVAPPGLPAAGYTPRYPSLAHAGGAWHLAYVETFSGALAYAEPVVIHSPDWDHWSFACWVPLEGFGEPRRATLVHFEGRYYLALERAVWWAAAYSPADPDRHLETAEVAAYVLEEEPWRGRALIELHNAAGRYDRPGQAGTPGAALRPLARVVVERGYRTPAGEERLGRAPCYLMSVAVRRGGPRPTLRLECDDGWGLLARWRPDGLYLWHGKTVAWLIAEVLYRAAGLTCSFDGLSAWEMRLDAFALAPGQWAETVGDTRRAWLSRELRAARIEPAGGSGLSALRSLVAMVGGAAHWRPDGRLHCFIPSAQGHAGAYAVGSGGEVLDALYGHGLMLPTQARVFGDGVGAAAAAPRARGAPRRYLATVVDPELSNALECAQRASALVYDGQARGVVGWVETPCQPGLELYDLVTVEDPRAGGLAGAELRVVGIVERYDPAAGVFITRATMEAA